MPASNSAFRSSSTVSPHDSGATTAAFRFGTTGPPCLLLHGFTGSPWDLRPLADALQARGFQGVVPLLPGHGGAPEAMAQASHHDWLAAAEAALGELAAREASGAMGKPVRVAGFSMGSLLAVVLAARRPREVAALALLAPAARLVGLGPRVARALRFFDFPERLLPYVSKGPPDLEDAGARAQSPGPSRVPMKSLRELFALQDLAHALAPSVRAKVQVVLAAQDHVVDARAALALAARLPVVGPAVVLPRGFHGLARDGSRAQLAEVVASFFSQSG